MKKYITTNDHQVQIHNHKLSSSPNTNKRLESSSIPRETIIEKKNHAKCGLSSMLIHPTIAFDISNHVVDILPSLPWPTLGSTTMALQGQNRFDGLI